MDDTIELLSVAWVDWLNKAYGTSVHREDLTDWDTAKFFPELTKDQVFEPLFVDEFWETVQPMPGAYEFIEQLIKDGHEIYIVTSSCHETIRSKLDNVLYKYFPMIDRQHVIITYNKQMIKGDVLIDDAIHNHIGGDYFKILIDAPYNQGDVEQYGIHRALDWGDVYEMIKSLERPSRCVGVYSGNKKIRNDIFTEGD